MISGDLRRGNVREHGAGQAGLREHRRQDEETEATERVLVDGIEYAADVALYEANVIWQIEAEGEHCLVDHAGLCNDVTRRTGEVS